MNKSPCSTSAAERRSSSLRELRPSLHWKGLLFIARASRLYWLCPLKGTGNCSSCYCCQLISGDVADTTAKYPSLSHGLRLLCTSNEKKAALPTTITHLCADIGAVDPSNNRNSCLEMLDATGASGNHAAVPPISLPSQVHKDFLSELGFVTIFSESNVF